MSGKRTRLDSARVSPGMERESAMAGPQPGRTGSDYLPCSLRSFHGAKADCNRDRAGHSTHLTFRFAPEVAPDTTLNVKVEVNTREHANLLGLKTYPFELVNGWHEARAGIVSFEPEELFGTKLRALLQRRQGRDLFDLKCLRSLPPRVQSTLISPCAQRDATQLMGISRTTLASSLGHPDWCNLGASAQLLLWSDRGCG